METIKIQILFIKENKTLTLFEIARIQLKHTVCVYWKLNHHLIENNLLYTLIFIIYYNFQFG